MSDYKLTNKQNLKKNHTKPQGQLHGKNFRGHTITSCGLQMATGPWVWDPCYKWISLIKKLCTLSICIHTLGKRCITVFLFYLFTFFSQVKMDESSHLQHLTQARPKGNRNRRPPTRIHMKEVFVIECANMRKFLNPCEVCRLFHWKSTQRYLYST